VRWAEHWERAKTAFLLAWALAVVPNAVDPFGHHGGALWQVVRYGVSALWLVAFVYWLVALIQ
jgi:hypothetical protein